MKVPIGSLRFGQIAFGDFGNPGNVNCHSLKAEVIRRAYPEPVLSKVEASNAVSLALLCCFSGGPPATARLWEYNSPHLAFP